MTTNIGNDGRVSSITMTRTEWNAKHPDFKGGTFGKDARCLVLDTNGATVSVPVSQEEALTKAQQLDVLLDFIAAYQNEAEPREFFREWLCPDTMNLESTTGREAREELLRLHSESHKGE